ncbi:RICIN domain-containing protein [Actinacidiphila yeochonensis]|uniref:RICIN domain-containing protein n=1 Tax=Actinacidiphila yeochonensis TaxID=89050 RepID=UPI0007C77151|nr:ricin-type beta-trefoil lectin domain protein [Actinacidiphila yeochonensis]
MAPHTPGTGLRGRVRTALRRAPLARRLRRLAVPAAVAGLALGLGGGVNPAQAATIGTTPGTYTNYAFTGSPTLADVTWSTTVLTDPGFSSQVFWAHQFGFDVGNGAYVGMQSDGGSNRLFLFSVWDATQATAGSAGTSCAAFGGEGTGESCRMNLNWTAGHTYTFTVAAQGSGWFGATVKNTTAGTSFTLGSIKTPATAIASTGMVDWTEYFEWNDPRATCYDQPFSAARFGLPTGNGGTVTARVSGTSNNGNACAAMTRTDSVAGGTVQNLATGNSVRGAVTGLAGKCLDSLGGVSDGTAADLYACSGGVGQAWVRAADGTLRLRSDYCLAANGTASGSAVLVSDCAGTGPGGAVTDTSKLWTYNATTKALVNQASGRCLDVPASNSANGTALIVYGCTGNPNQQWTLPAAS